MEHTPDLEYLALVGRVHEMDHTLAFVDGVINLLTKASRAIDTGTPRGREQARALIDRAEKYLPDSTGLDEQGRQAVSLAVATIDSVRRELDDAALAAEVAPPGETGPA